MLHESKRRALGKHWLSGFGRKKIHFRGNIFVWIVPKADSEINIPA